MKLFQSAQKTLTALGVSPDRKPFNGITLSIILVFVSMISFYVVFLLNMAKTFKEYTDNIYLTASTSIITFCFVVVAFKMEKIFALIDRFENCVNKRSENSETSKAIYIKTNELVEKLSGLFYIGVVYISPLIWVVPKSLGSLFFYFTTDLGSDALESPLPVWYPLDFTSLPRYLIIVMLQYIITRYTFVVVAAGMSFGTGGFLFAVSISDDIKDILRSVNVNATTKNNHSKALNHLSLFIEIHSTLKQFIQDFVGIFQPILIAIFTWSLVTICGTMLMFQVELSLGKIDSVVLFVTIFYASYAFGLIGVVCEFGSRISSAFEEIEGLIGEFNWYWFPDELKKDLPTFLIVAQQPVDMVCFGSITCSRSSFKKVMNSSYSYFTVLRKFYD